jgi:hypothetical protein
MEQCLFIKSSRQNGLWCMQIHFKLLELYADNALSYSEVCSWSRQFLIDREYVEDARRTDQPPDLGFRLRIQSALEKLPIASVQCIASKNVSDNKRD